MCLYPLFSTLGDSCISKRHASVNCGAGVKSANGAVLTNESFGCIIGNIEAPGTWYAWAGIGRGAAVNPNPFRNVIIPTVSVVFRALAAMVHYVQRFTDDPADSHWALDEFAQIKNDTSLDAAVASRTCSSASTTALQQSANVSSSQGPSMSGVPNVRMRKTQDQESAAVDAAAPLASSPKDQHVAIAYTDQQQPQIFTQDEGKAATEPSWKWHLICAKVAASAHTVRRWRLCLHTWMSLTFALDFATTMVLWVDTSTALSLALLDTDVYPLIPLYVVVSGGLKALAVAGFSWARWLDVFPLVCCAVTQRLSCHPMLLGLSEVLVGNVAQQLRTRHECAECTLQTQA